jgi:uncharacterized repeat protein (TIGR01451 family)
MRGRWVAAVGSLAVAASLVVPSGAALESAVASADTCPTITLTPHDPSFYTLPDGRVGTEYETSIVASGGSGSYYWQLAGGALPPGLTWSPQGFGGDTLTISGTPTTAGTYGVQFDVQDAPGGQVSPCVATGGNYQINVPQADVGIALGANPQEVKVGDEVTFTADVTNFGPFAASGVVVTDRIPLSYDVTDAYWAPTSGGATHPCAKEPRVSCQIGGLTDGSHDDGNRVTVTIVATAVGTPGVQDTARVSSTSDDPNPANNTSSANVTIDALTADLDVAIVTDRDRVHSLDTIRYVIGVDNKGPDRAVRPELFFALRRDDGDQPASSSVVVVSASASLGTCTEHSDYVTCQASSLDQGEHWRIVVHARPYKEFVKPRLEGHVSVSSSSHDPVLSNNSDDALVRVDPVADLHVDVRPHGKRPDDPDDEFVDVTNDGPDAAHVRLSVRLSHEGTIRVTVVGPLGHKAATLTCDPKRHHVKHVLCTGRLVDEAGVRLRIHYKPDHPRPDKVSIEAEATSPVHDPHPVDNTDKVTDKYR